MPLIIETMTPHDGWFLVCSKYRREFRALQNLQERGFVAYCPMIPSSGKPKPLFPGYLFIQVNSFSKLCELKWIPGLSKLVQFNDIEHSKSAGNAYPAPIHNGSKIIQEIKLLEKSIIQKKSELAFKREVLYSTDTSEIVKGLFVKKIDSDRGLVLLEIIKSKMNQTKNKPFSKLTVVSLNSLKLA